MDGVEIKRIGTSGLFAVTVDAPKKGATYTFTQGDAVRSVLRDLGIRVRTIAPEHLGNPVGAIAGMPGMRPARNAFEGQAPRDEFMLVCPMPNALINEMLAAMREANVSIAHKAQVTAHNRLWPMHVLMAEIAKEHAAMTQNAQ